MKPAHRKKSRQLAVQALYSWQMTGNSIHEIEVHLAAENSMKGADIEYFQSLIRGVASNASELDDAMKPYLGVGRDFEDLDQLEKVILRMSLFELQEKLDVPYRVVLNEAIELGKSFCAEDSHKFINGVLDKAIAKFRKLEVEAEKAEKKG